MAPSRFSGGSRAKGADDPIAQLRAAVQRLLGMRRVRSGGMAVAALLIAFTGWTLFYGPPTSCRRSPQRKEAVKLLMTTADPVTKEPLGERFARGDFRCATLAATDVAPGGLLVEAHDGEDPVTWFFDGKGVPYNVNQLAAAWTPAFDASPRITTEQLAALRE